MKKVAFGFILGIIVCFVVSAIAETIHSDEVLYDNSNSNTSSTDVQEALDTLFTIVDHSSLSFSLLSHNPTGISTNLVAGLYRYQGVQNNDTNVDNYICFGTTDKNSCLSNQNNFMYRIIGIAPEGQLKVIKMTSIGSSVWNDKDGTLWGSCTLYNKLNGYYFLENTNYIPVGWSNKIEMSSWHSGYITNSTAATISERELALPVVTGKIGIISLHDYANTMVEPSYSNQSWIHISKNDSNNSTGWEWMLNSKDSNFGWMLISGGSVATDLYLSNGVNIRPVFYISASERIASGSGTITDPYLLS